MILNPIDGCLFGIEQSPLGESVTEETKTHVVPNMAGFSRFFFWLIPGNLYQEFLSFALEQYFESRFKPSETPQ